MCLDVWLRVYRYAEEIREHVLPSMLSSPAQLTRLKRGISTLAASQVETVWARSSVIDPIYRVAPLTSTETWSTREAEREGLFGNHDRRTSGFQGREPGMECLAGDGS
jgi:hypothetical protein